ncbi:MAG: M48 family metallopeptidase [Candidatus Omnitrophota bacterium]|nr:M48 family metallopeptidase [Candidatus Omnitrophota bacterium]MDZ4243349.1 M48 family metallopeptidase [Candidatus Omnitrophota bacterium]
MTTSDTVRQYHRARKMCAYAGWTLDTVVWLLMAGGFSLMVREGAAEFSSHQAVINAIYITVLAAGMSLLHFPLRFFLGFILEHSFRLSNQTFFGWWKDDLKQSALGFAVMLVLVEVLYAFLGRFPSTWWIWAAVFWLFVALFLARIFPQYIIPLFFKYSAVENTDLRARIRDLFTRCRVELKDVYLIDLSTKTKKANAFVCGLGKSRRVVLSDTLVANFTPAEIEAVVAHEIGHHKHKDILKILAFNTALTFLGFYLLDMLLRELLPRLGAQRLDDIAYFPVLALAANFYGLVTAPLANAFSRRIETRADRFSLELTRRTDDFISMMKKLGELNLADFEPSWFDVMMFYDHPPVGERIRFAQQFKMS